MSCGKECENCGQVGGDGYAMSMTENIAGQPVVEAYNCCDNPSVPAANVADATNQVGGGVNPFNFIINPVTGARLSLFSSGGKALLKNMIRQYKAGGMDGVTDSSATSVTVKDVDEADAEDAEDAEDAADTAVEEGTADDGAESKLPETETETETVAGTPAAESEVVGEPEESKGEEGEVETGKGKLENAVNSLSKVDNIVDLAQTAIEAAENYNDDNKEEALGAARIFLDASRGTNGDSPEPKKLEAQDKLEGVIEELSGGKDVMGGGAPAEMTDAFGEDYFNTEADALRGSWD